MQFLLDNQNAVIRSFVENPLELKEESHTMLHILRALGVGDKPDFKAAIKKAKELNYCSGNTQTIINICFSPQKYGGWFACVRNLPYWLVSEKQDFTDPDTWETKIVKAYNREHAFHLVNQYWNREDDYGRYQINAVKLTKNQVIELDIE